MSTNPRTIDARNRSLRTLVVGLAIDVLVGVALVLSTYFATASTWDDVEWAVLGFSVAKSVVQAIGAYILRQFVDKGTDVVLPPADPGHPAADPVPFNDGLDHDEQGNAHLITLIVIAGLLFVLVLIASGLITIGR